MFVADQLSAHIAEHGTGEHGLILHQPDGRPIGGADWMGHASPMVTLNTYAHMMPIDEDRGRLVLDSALGPKRAESILRTAES